MEPTNEKMNPKEEYTFEEVVAAMYPQEDFSPEERETLIGETVAMVSEAALLRGINQAGEDAQTAFEALMDGDPSEEQMQSFVTLHIPNYSDLIIEEVNHFYEMGTMGKSESTEAEGDK